MIGVCGCLIVILFLIAELNNTWPGAQQKVQFSMSAHRILRLECASAQSDQNLRCAPYG